MSTYQNFVQDFPTRCLALLRTTENYRPELAVTQLIMVASSALIIPFERLRERPMSSPIVEHPDIQKHKKLSRSLHSELQVPLEESAFWNCFKNPVRYNSAPRPTTIEFEATRPLRPSTKTYTFINTIRNALAHGNIYVNSDSKGQIATLTFGASIKNSNQFSFITIEVDDFRRFMTTWVKLLEQERRYLVDIMIDTEVVEDDEIHFSTSI